MGKNPPGPMWGHLRPFFPWTEKIQKMPKFCLFSLVGQWAPIHPVWALAAIHPRWGNRLLLFLIVTPRVLWVSANFSRFPDFQISRRCQRRCRPTNSQISTSRLSRHTQVGHTSQGALAATIRTTKSEWVLRLADKMVLALVVHRF